MDGQMEFHYIAQEFSRGGSDVALIENSTFRIRAHGITLDFKLPKRSGINLRRLPGWFLADIWDIMNLPDLGILPGENHLSAWQFEIYEQCLWAKPLPVEPQKRLIYHPNTGRLYIEDVWGGENVAIGPCPSRSIFHVQKMFEENNWLEQDEVLAGSLRAIDYVV